MKIERYLTTKMTIQEFATIHDLTMEVHERINSGPLVRYYAHFKHAETLYDNMLTADFGNGSNEEEAIINYGQTISGKLLVINSRSTDRKEIRVPKIIVLNNVKKNDYI